MFKLHTVNCQSSAKLSVHHVIMSSDLIASLQAMTVTVTVCVDWRKIVKMASVCISTLVSKLLSIITNYCKINFLMFISLRKYVVKHKSTKLLMTYAVGKLEAGTLMH